MILISI